MINIIKEWSERSHGENNYNLNLYNFKLDTLIDRLNCNGVPDDSDHVIVVVLVGKMPPPDVSEPVFSTSS